MARRRSRPTEDHRSDARERALALLYEAESKGVPPRDVLASQVSDVDEITTLIVEGVEDGQAEIDGLLVEYSKGWSLARMPSIDRAVLRMAVFELRDRPDVPTAVVLDEAVELAKRFSTEDSGRFVNGMLAAIAPTVRSPG